MNIIRKILLEESTNLNDRLVKGILILAWKNIYKFRSITKKDFNDFPNTFDGFINYVKQQSLPTQKISLIVSIK